MLFQQTAAPVFWTKITTHDDKALRVVSGTAGSGGTNAFSTVMGSAAAVVDGHAITINEMPSHGRPYTEPNSTPGQTAGGAFAATTGGTPATTGPTGGGAAHVESADALVLSVDLLPTAIDRFRQNSAAGGPASPPSYR